MICADFAFGGIKKSGHVVGRSNMVRETVVNVTSEIYNVLFILLHVYVHIHTSGWHFSTILKQLSYAFTPSASF